MFLVNKLNRGLAILAKVQRYVIVKSYNLLLNFHKYFEQQIIL